MITFSNAAIDKSVFITFAASGAVSTPKFREKFDIEKFNSEAYYKIEIRSSYTVYDYETDNYESDVEIEIDLEFDTNPNHECISLDSESNGCINKNKTRYKEILKNFEERRIIFRRDFRTKEDLKEWKNKRFTGFRLKWKCKNCDGKKFTDDGYRFFDTKLNHENKLFNKMANLVQNAQEKFDINPEDIWNALKIAKTSGYFQ